MAETLKPTDLSAAERGAVGGLKRTVTALTDKYAVVRETVAQVAPRVIKLFKELEAKYDNLGGFAGFARLFDPEVPTNAGTDEKPGYRQNKTYIALDYMRRVERQKTTVRGQQGQRDPATDQLARTLATVLQVVRPDAREVVWKAISEQFGLTDRARGRLEARVARSKPIIDLSGVRPVAVDESKVIQMPRIVARGEGAGTVEAAAREAVPARRGRRAAGRGRAAA